MKPAAILTAIILGIASLSVVAFVGQHKKTTVTASNPDPWNDEENEYGGLTLPQSGPFGQVEVDEREFDFGTKRVRTASEHNFKLKNVGEGSLTVRLGKPTCQCTAFEITKEGDTSGSQKISETGSDITVAPGEVLNCLLKWKMRSTNSNFRQVAPLYTTDPKQRRLDLAIRGAIDSPVTLLPGSFWDFGEMSLTEPSVAKGAIYSTVYEKFELSFTPPEGSFATITWTPMTEETLKELSPAEDSSSEPLKKVKHTADVTVKSGYHLEVKAGPNVPLGYFKEALPLICNFDPDHTHAPKEPVPTSDQATATSKEPAKHDHDHGDHKHDAASDDSDIDAEPELMLTSIITVSGRRSGPIELRGIDSGSKLNIASNRVLLGKFPAEEGKKAKVTLFAKGMEEELVINAVEPANTPVKIKFLGPGMMMGKSKKYDLEVEVPPGPAAKHTENDALSVSLKLNHPEANDFRMLIDYTATR